MSKPVPSRKLEIVRGKTRTVGAFVALWGERILDQMYFDKETAFILPQNAPLPVVWKVTSTAGIFFDVVVGKMVRFERMDEGVYATIQLGAPTAEESLIESLLKFIDTPKKEVLALISSSHPNHCKVDVDHRFISYPAKGILLYTPDQVEQEGQDGRSKRPIHASA